MNCFVVGTACNGRVRSEQADTAVVCCRDGLDSLGPDNSEHLNAKRRLAHPLLKYGQRSRGSRVAGDNEELCVAGQQLFGNLKAEASELIRRAFAVREASGITEIDVVLSREMNEQLVQHSKAADAGVEYGNRPLARVADRGHRLSIGLSATGSRPRAADTVDRFLQLRHDGLRNAAAL